MFVKVSRTPINGGNKGSCSLLVNYLEKESEGEFHDKDNNVISANDVQKGIDEHVINSKLSNNEAKFYMITIAPSKDEINHLVGRNVNSIDELSAEEKQGLNEKLNDYTTNVMDEYAKNFHREDKGICSSKDLVYYSRIEQNREYKSTDSEVKNGTAKAGEQKEGMQTHIHVIVSRLSADKQVQLSPMAKPKEKTVNSNINEKADVGFNHLDWKKNCTENFNSTFKYKEKEYTTEKLYSNQKKFGSDLDKLGNDASNKVTQKIKKEAITNTGSSITQTLGTEKKMIDGAKKAITAVTNPKAAILQAAKDTLKKLISRGMEM